MVILTCFEAEQATETSCFKLIHSVGKNLVSDLLKRKNKKDLSKPQPNRSQRMKTAYEYAWRDKKCFCVGNPVIQLFAEKLQTISFSSPTRLQLILIVEMFASLYTDGSYKSSSQEASDVLSEILKNLPHKPMKSVGHSQYSGGGHSQSGHSFNQLPIPDDPQPPPFKPLNEYPPYDISYDTPQSIQSHYGPPNHFSDFSAQGSAKSPVAVNPKAYDIYHSMKIKLKKEKNFVTLPTFIDGKGLDIQKSIGFELTA